MLTRLGSWRRLAARPPAIAAAAASALAGLALVVTLTAGGDAAPPEKAVPPVEQTQPAMRSEPRTTVRAVAAPTAPPTPVSSAALPTSSSTTRVLVPQIGIDAPVVPIPLKPGGVLDPPEAVSDVGWWDDSARAGDEQGQTVLTGHTVSSGGGVMDDLDYLERGDRVRVTDPEGFVDYEITEVVTWSKSELTQNAVEAFGQDRHHGRLVLVTCEDWNGGTYDSNVVAFAEPVSAA